MVLFVMILQTEVFWQRMICIVVMVLIFLLRNHTKVISDSKKKIDSNDDK